MVARTFSTLILYAAAVFIPGVGLLYAAETPNTGMADPGALISQYDQFLKDSPASKQYLVMPLGSLRGITASGFNAGGSVQIDLMTGVVTSRVKGLPKDAAFDLWLVRNRSGAGHTSLTEGHDVSVRVGAYQFQSGAHTLSATIGGEWLRNALPDRAFVVSANQTPVSSFVLTGSANVLERLLHRQVRLNDGEDGGFDPNAPTTRARDFGRLVAYGRQIFLKETFAGNGRACGTCHVESNNFTLDPSFIATLPHTDPLFVAENNPALASGFEKPDLMRQFGLILVNADGFDDLKTRFTMRSVQSVLALRNSSVRPDPVFAVDFTSNGMNADPAERLGWGNDGAPLRDFAIVAIAQHATRTLARRPGIDFRVPNDPELDALAAYQLALGRQEDFDLQSLQLKSDLASTGKALFLDTGNIAEPGHKNCNACHFNAGGTTGISFNPQTPGFSPRLDGNARGFNMAAPINTNETPMALSLHLPRDGGFGVVPTPLGAFGNFAQIPAGLLPVEEFNAPPLVEAADTAPFFHNHTVPDLESAVAFYGSPAFKNGLSSIGGPNGVVFVNISSDANDSEVQAIAAFLRVLNTLENIRSAQSLAARARAMEAEPDIRDLARLALGETNDAIAVLGGGALAKSTEAGILSARTYLTAARESLESVGREHSRPRIDDAVDQTASNLRLARSALANLSTLPPSYRK